MYNFDDFTTQEIDILIEALDEWVAKDFSGRMMSGLLDAMLLKDMPPEKRQEHEEKSRRDEENRKRKKKLRIEQSIVMKAKLLKARDSMEASSL